MKFITILIPLIPIIVFFIVSEISIKNIYGKFITKKAELQIIKILEKYELSGLQNQLGKLPITSIFSKYYLNGIGTVPRWSKLHKKINEIERGENKNKNNSKESAITFSDY